MKSWEARSVAVLCAVLVVVSLQTSIRTVAAASAVPADNVAIQWNILGTSLICSAPGFKIFGTGIILPHLQLAQWHALLALKGARGTTEEAVVAYASHRVLSEYFPLSKDASIDILLTGQINALGLTESQQKLGKRLGAAVALEVMDSKKYVREFALKEVKDDLTARLATRTPGLFTYHNDTPAGQQAQVLANYVNSRTFVLPDVTDYIENDLSAFRPPAVPSAQWDAEYDFLINIGRANWPGRTKETNYTSAIYACFVSGHCSMEDLSFKVARTVLPSTTSLSDTVLLFAKLAVTCHDALITVLNMQWGYSFWRPFTAFRRGDPHHSSIPSWTPFADNPYHPEYPSGTATVLSAGITAIEIFLGKKVVSFDLDRGAVTPEAVTCRIPPGTPLGVRHYSSLQAIVKEAQNGRMWAGGHWNISVTDGAKVGAKVAKYVEKRWGRSKTSPYGVLPNSIYLNVVAKQPKKAGEFSPLTVDY